MPANNECLSRDDVGAQVNSRLLQWKTESAPTLGARVVTRSWFNTYVDNVGGFPADGRLMTWGQMETYRFLGPRGAPTITSVQNTSTCDFDNPNYKVTIYWSNGDPLAYTYFEYQKPGANTWTYLGSANPGETSYTFHMFDGPGTYYIRAWHSRSGVSSAYSASNQVWIENPCGWDDNPGGPGEPGGPGGPGGPGEPEPPIDDPIEPEAVTTSEKEV